MQCEPGEVAVLREQIASKDAQIVKLQARIAELEREAAERAAGSDVENDPPDETPRRRRKRKQRLAQLKRRLAARDTAAAGGSGDAAGDAGTADQEPSGEGGGADDTAGEDGGADDTAGEDGGADGRAGPGVFSGAAARLLIDELELALLQRLEEIEFKDKINDLQPAYGCRHCAYCPACEAQGEQLAVHCKVALIARKKEVRHRPGVANDGSHLLEWYRAAYARLQADDACLCPHSTDPTLPCTCEATVADLLELIEWRMREFQHIMDTCLQGEGYYGVLSAAAAWTSYVDEFAERIVEVERAARQAHRNLQ
jgi:hypothetical protein